MSSTGTTTCSSMRLGLGGCTTVTARVPPRNVATSSTGRTVAESPTRWAGGASPRSASRRSRDSARWAPRLLPATACTSSTMTVSTPRRVSLACEVSSRNSDSGVVMRMSGGLAGQLPAFLGGGVAGAHRHRDVRLVQAEPVRGVPDPGQRGAQVPLDVHGQRLERGDVEHPGAPFRVGGRWHRRQLVDRPQERGQRLARTGRRDDQRVLALADRPPRPRLGLRRLRERPVEPRPRGRREPVARVVAGNGRISCHPSILPRPTDISGRALQ